MAILSLSAETLNQSISETRTNITEIIRKIERTTFGERTCQYRTEVDEIIDKKGKS
jgi:DNA-binding transcriptional regulator YdaS (Cro superfamily)